MNYVIFFIVLGIACFLIGRVPFIKNSGLGTRLITILFLFKVCIGVAQAYINAVYFPGSDTWGINNWSLEEYHLMLKDPSTFIRELYTSNYNGTGYNNLFGSFGSFWNDLELNLLVKSLAPFNAISQGNYYINSVFVNFVGFFGHIALYRVFHHIYQKKIPVLAGCFLLPSFLFFSSAIGKDNVAFTMLAMLCFALYFFTLAGFTAKRCGWLLLFFAGLLLMRNHIALLIIPPAVAYYTSVKTKKNPWLVFGITAIVLAILLFVVPAVLPAINPAQIISQKQQDFLALGTANTQVDLNLLEPTSASLLKNLPQALAHGFFRPYPSDIKNGFSLAEVAEIIMYVLVFIVALFYTIKSGSFKYIHPFVLFCIMLCCLVFIMNGYIVPNFNTLVRYRSIYLPLIIIPLLCSLPFQFKTLKL